MRAVLALAALCSAACPRFSEPYGCGASGECPDGLACDVASRLCVPSSPAPDASCPPLAAGCGPCEHDGGGGECVPIGLCSPSYHLDPRGRCYRLVQGLETRYAHVQHGVVELPDARLLIVGGFGPDGDTSSTAELIDVRARRAVAAPAPSGPRLFRSAFLLTDGRVVAAGGENDGALAPDHPELRDPRDGSWRRAGAALSGRHFAAAIVSLADERVLIAGGARLSEREVAVELFDPATETVSTAAPMMEGRAAAAALRLLDGRVLVAGGSGSAGGRVVSLSSVELFDPRTEAWTTAPSMSHGREYASATLLEDGSVLVVGGLDQGRGGIGVAAVERYVPSEDRWESRAPLHVPRGQHTATRLSDGRVLVSGGQGMPMLDDPQQVLRSLELYDPALDRWDVLEVELAQARLLHVATRLRDDLVVFTGGPKDLGRAQDGTTLVEWLELAP